MKKMTQDDKQFLKEFLRGAGIIGVVVGLFILFASLTLQSQNPPVESQSTKVIGTYKECDIIQWHYGPLAEYKYFLHCPKWTRNLKSFIMSGAVLINAEDYIKEPIENTESTKLCVCALIWKMWSSTSLIQNDRNTYDDLLQTLLQTTSGNWYQEIQNVVGKLHLEWMFCSGLV